MNLVIIGSGRWTVFVLWVFPTNEDRVIEVSAMNRQARTYLLRRMVSLPPAPNVVKGIRLCLVKQLTNRA